ncbi:MAG: type IV toxin-antitoxin system AbiEi family antitoxin domain-containing protein [Acidimicrobiales bacterium]
MSDEWRVLTRAELHAEGHDEPAIRRLVRHGRLQRMARGVYLEGPRASGAQRWWQDVAVQAQLHPQATVSGQAAAAVLGLDGFDPPVPISVVAPSDRHGGAGVRRRRSVEAPLEVRGLWVTAVEDTLLTLAEDLSARPGCAAAGSPLDPFELVELAVECALRRELTTIERLRDAVAATTARRPGRAVLCAVLAVRPDEPPTGSYLETRCHQVLRAAGLPAFRRQVELHDHHGRIGTVDFALGQVVIEVVGERWHLERFGPDHRRYARLAAAGHRLLTFTFDDIEHQPGHVADATGRALRTRPLC